MSDFKTVTNSLRSHINNKSLYVPWIKITLGEFVCDTSAKKDNLFVSLQNIKNSAGLANKTNIVLAYVPSANIGIDNLGDDIDKIDMLLAGNGMKDIKFQYGFSYPNLKSPEYNMTIIDYNVSLRDGILFYTIEATSSLIKYVNVKASIEKYTEKKPTEVFEEVVTKYLGQEGYTVIWSEDVQGTDNIIEEIPGANEINIFDYLYSLMSMATYSEDDEETKDTERSMYTYSISDKNNKQIIVNRINSKSSGSKNDILVFDWMSGEDDIVIDFSTSFKGSVMMSKAYAEEFGQSNMYGISEKGTANPYYGTLSPTTGPKANSDYATERYNWARVATYGYKAQLQTIGIPAEYEMLDELHIIPWIYGKAHHTQGIYQITKVTDTIDSSGYISSFELIKKDSADVEAYYTDGYNSDAIAKAKESGLYTEDKRQVEEGQQFGNIGSGSPQIGTVGSGMHAKVVQIAQSQMEGKSGDVYWRFMGFSYRVAWCACFVSWVCSQAGATTFKSASCIQWYNHFNSKGAYQKGKGFGGTYNPKSGDIILFDWNKGGRCDDHIGIVESFDGSKVYTLEGNSSDMTRRRSYSITDKNISGYCLY